MSSWHWVLTHDTRARCSGFEKEANFSSLVSVVNVWRLRSFDEFEKLHEIDAHSFGVNGICMARSSSGAFASLTFGVKGERGQRKGRY